MELFGVYFSIIIDKSKNIKKRRYEDRQKFAIKSAFEPNKAEIEMFFKAK